jgi:threonine efflux protein
MMTPLISIAVIHFFALISPGPDFFFVTQSAIRQSRTHALCAALGVSLSILVWSICAISGLHFLFQKIAWLQQVLMTLGGLYLLYLGIQLLKSAFNKNPVPISKNQNEILPKKSHSTLLVQGFLTNMANPKALVYFSSVFSIAISTNVSIFEQSSLLALVFIESLIWFSAVALVFSTAKINISFGCLLILNRD